jgi:effector-binding domain-containing protein
MSVENGGIAIRPVPELLVAGIRSRGDLAAIPAHIARLLEQIGPSVIGPPICLYHEHNPYEGHDIEVCFPVAGAVNAGGITSRILPGGDMLVITHSGPPDAAGESWQALYRYAAEHGIGLTEGPAREVYRRTGEGVAPAVAEIMHPVLLPVWLDRLAEGLDRCAGPDIRRRVMAGSEALKPDSPGEAQAAWARDMVARLDSAIEDDGTRCQIMAGCAHVFPQARIDRARAEYERLAGDIDALLAFMHADPMHFYAMPRREGNRIVVSKQPAERQRYEAATDPAEKRAAYCHCRMIKAAIRAQDQVSPTYCYCGGGWYRRLWEGILGQPVGIELRESVLQGDERCTFAIVLPEA